MANNNLLRLFLTTVTAALVLTACTLTPAIAPTPTIQADPTNPPAPPEPTTTPEGPEETDLPAALYLLSEDQNGRFQVWRISQDRTTTDKLTAEPEPVDDFSVNSTTGQIAYLTNNQIYLINADTSGRTLLVDGSGYDEESDSFFFREKINGLAWSQDGAELAYGQNGLNIYNIASETSQNIIQNDLEEQDSGLIFPNALYSPLMWSPDGSLLLVDIGFYEAGTLGIYNPDSSKVTRLGEGIVCCYPTWSPDSRAIVVGSPYFGMVESGLWRYDVSTGEKTELIPTTSPDNTLNYAGWPLALPDGQLQFFYGNTPDFPTGEVPLVMVHTAADGQTDLTILRDEEWTNYEVIWSPDGRLAMTVQPAIGEPAGWPRIGPVVLIPASGSPVIPLGLNGYQLQWGP